MNHRHHHKRKLAALARLLEERRPRTFELVIADLEALAARRRYGRKPVRPMESRTHG